MKQFYLYKKIVHLVNTSNLIIPTHLCSTSKFKHLRYCTNNFLIWIYIKKIRLLDTKVNLFKKRYYSL